MQLLDERQGKRTAGAVDDRIDGPEVVNCLGYIVDMHRLAVGQDSSRLENEPRLLGSEGAAFHMVRSVREVHLHTMVDAAVHGRLLLLLQANEQRRRHGPLRVQSRGLHRISRNEPRLSAQLSTGNAPLSAVIPHAALGHSPAQSRFRNRMELCG